MSKELKPCPFCGGNAELRVYTADTQFAQCVSCLAGSTAFSNSEEAVAAWNKRNTLLSRLRRVVKSWLED